MVLVAFLLLAFMVGYGAIASKTLSAMDAKANEDAREISDKVASEINTAFAEGGGYSKSFMLPDNIGGKNYTVLVEKGLVFVDWPKNSVASGTIVENVTGNFTIGWNLLENNGGVIFANQ